MRFLLIGLILAAASIGSLGCSSSKHSTIIPATSTTATELLTSPAEQLTQSVLGIQVYPESLVYEEPVIAEVTVIEKTIVATGISRPVQVEVGVPWFVPEDRIEDYKVCLVHPERYNRTTWILSVDWPRVDAEYIADHEGGWDLCQFNTQGSGACGWFQLLTCPPDGLTPEGNIRGAYAKYLDGGRDFWRHWLQWWPPKSN